jgi:hypothetical protein
MAEIAHILRVDNDPRLPAFQLALRELGTDRRRAIASMPIGFPDAPFDLSMTKRVEWLATHVLTPADTLLDAISENRLPYFSEWPGDDRIPARPGFVELTGNLSSLRDYAKALQLALADQLAANAQHTPEMRYDIVTSLIALLAEHFPEVPRTRGQYAKSLKSTVGQLPDFVRRAFVEITRSNEQLDAPIQATVEAERKPRPRRG